MFHFEKLESYNRLDPQGDNRLYSFQVIPETHWMWKMVARESMLTPFDHFQ